MKTKLGRFFEQKWTRMLFYVISWATIIEHRYKLRRNDDTKIGCASGKKQQLARQSRASRATSSCLQRVKHHTKILILEEACLSISLYSLFFFFSFVSCRACRKKDDSLARSHQSALSFYCRRRGWQTFLFSPTGHGLMACAHYTEQREPWTYTLKYSSLTEMRHHAGTNTITSVSKSRNVDHNRKQQKKGHVVI